MNFRQIFYDVRKKLYNLSTYFGYKYNLKVYNHAFFIDNQDEGLKHAKWFIPLLKNSFGFNSLLDIGCGTGHFLKACLEAGIKDVYGIEGAMDALGKLLLVKRDLVHQHDLRKPLKLNRRWDICISIEVAEHIDRLYVDNYIKIMKDASDLIVLTAARPKQGGVAHVNEQPQEWWKDRFNKFNYKFNEQKVKMLKVGMEQARKNGFHVAEWFEPNIMVFEKII